MSPRLLSNTPFRRKRRRRVDETVAAHYDSAMYAVRMLGDELVAAAANGASAAQRRLLHARVDHELARAIAAASAIYNYLFETAGGVHHAEVDRDVQLWKRRLNTALTVRSQHQLAAIDDAGVVVPVNARVRSRSAFGPHQAGMDFDAEPEPAPAGDLGLGLDDIVDLTTAARAPDLAQPQVT
jgi:hypothetical protein